MAATANNWPPLPEKFCCRPCFYQNISEEIHLEYRKTVKSVYYLWMYYSFVLLLNLIGALAVFITQGNFVIFVVALIISILFIPLSYVCWFRPLYNAFRTNSSFNFIIFFFNFGLQLLITLLYTIGVPITGACGFILAGELLHAGWKGLGIFVMIISFFHLALVIWSAVTIVKVNQLYRSTGASFAKAQQEFSQGVLSNEHVQTAATQAATGAAHTAVNQALSGNQ